MNSEFKNFGEALAWMMESPENVAERDDVPGAHYRFCDTLQVCSTDHDWVPSLCIDEYFHATWSRAKKEPKVFRFEGEVDHCVANDFTIGGRSSAWEFNSALKPFSEGTKVEVVLTVHEEAN